jgi:4-carboxymuconolactone decarboxylase
MKRLTLTLFACAVAASAQERMPQLKLEDTAGPQRALAERMIKETRSGLTGPFNAMLRSPEMSEGLMSLYNYFRHNTALPRPLVELAILVTAREWSTQFEWYMHYPIARTEGVPDALLTELREGRRPASMKPEEEAVFDFTRQLIREHKVDDATYRKTLALLGEKNVVDLTGLIGTYATYAALLNVNAQKIPVESGPRFMPVR